ncbi:hypothetical protein [Nonomuraea sp. NPDC046570]
MTSPLSSPATALTSLGIIGTPPPRAWVSYRRAAELFEQAAADLAGRP